MDLKTLAQSGTNLGRIGGEGLGPFAKTGLGPLESLQAITRVVSGIVGVMTIGAGIWFLIQVLLAGIAWIQGEGDVKKLQTAQKRLTGAFVGLLIVVSGTIIVSLASKFIGYDILITNPAELIRILTP